MVAQCRSDTWPCKLAQRSAAFRKPHGAVHQRTKVGSIQCNASWTRAGVGGAFCGQ